MVLSVSGLAGVEILAFGTEISEPHHFIKYIRNGYRRGILGRGHGGGEWF